MKYLLALALIMFSLNLTIAPVPANHISMKDVQCLAANIHFEAQGESKKGKIAVGHVTLNRVNDPNFPKTICSVVKQPGQFSWYAKADITKLKIPRATKQLAYEIVQGKYKDITLGAVYFHNGTVDAFKRKITTKIGAHTFYS